LSPEFGKEEAISMDFCFRSFTLRRMAERMLAHRAEQFDFWTPYRIESILLIGTISPVLAAASVYAVCEKEEPLTTS